MYIVHFHFRIGEPNFYDMDIDDTVQDCPVVKVADIKKLSDDYIEVNFSHADSYKIP